MSVPDTSLLSKASLFSLAYGFVKKSDRVNKLAERAYLAVFGGWDKVVKNAARLIPFERLADGTVKRPAANDGELADGTDGTANDGSGTACGAEPAALAVSALHF